MRTNNILSFTSAATGAALVAFVIAACGKSDPADAERPAPAAVAEHHEAHSGHGHAPAEAAADKASIKNGFDGMPAPGTPAFCPIMKQEFKVAADSPYSVYKGKTYVFCCPACKPTFEADPEKHIAM